MQTATAMDAQPHSLNPKLSAFEAARDEYLERQATFRETITEIERMRAAATALQVQAEQAIASWKSMATQRPVNQPKISAEMNRAADLRQQAEQLIRTADAREELRKVLAVGLAEARFGLHDFAEAANDSNRAERLRELLATPGLKDALSEIYAICRADFNKAISEEELMFRRARGSLESARVMSFIEAVGLSAQAAPVVAAVPAPVSGEVVATLRGALRKFIAAGGEIPLEAIMPGAIPSKVPAGLKQY